MIKTPTDKETGEVLSQYPQRLRLKIPFYDGKFNCEVFDKEGNKIEDPMEEILVKGTRVKAIIECVGLWIASASYMCQWKVVRMEADVQKVTRGPAFLPDTDDEGDDGDSDAPAAAPAPEPEPEPEEESEEDDSDAETESEDDDDDSEEEAPPPPPEPKKKAKASTAKGGKKTKK